MQAQLRISRGRSLPPLADRGQWRHEARTFVDLWVAALRACQATITAPLRIHALGLAMVVAVLRDDAVALSTRCTDDQELAEAARHDVAVEMVPLECSFCAGGDSVRKGPRPVASVQRENDFVVWCHASATVCRHVLHP